MDNVIMLSVRSNNGVVSRPLDLEQIRRSNVLMHSSDARAFRMLFGYEKNGFSEKDEETIEQKYHRLMKDMQIHDSDLHQLYELLVTGRPNKYSVEKLWKFGIFVRGEDAC